MHSLAVGSGYFCRYLRWSGTVGLSVASFLAASAGVTEGAEKTQGTVAPVIRFCPGTEVWTYPLESQRSLQSLMLQAVALVNPRGADEFGAESMEIQLLSKGEVKDSRFLGKAELAKNAAAAPQIEGLNQVLPGQLCDGALVKDLKLAKSTALGSGEALVVMNETFAGSGERDAVRVIVRGRGKGGPVEVKEELPIRGGMSKTAFRFPLRGDWFIGAGPTLHSHHRWGTMEEFAYDIMKVGDKGRSYSGEGLKFSDYYAYGAPVLAAADGEVVEVVNDVPEDASAMRRPDETQEAYRNRLIGEQGKRLAGGARGIIGNCVILDHGNGEFSIYAHLQPGSVRVEKGQKVKAGDEMAKLGSSGNSTEPHLHFQVSNAPKALTAAGIPARFVEIEIPMELGPRPLQSGDLVTAK
ncbi:MAG TPA: M23 family metallopeptidase [Chthoniobacterales bacterium]|jgi:murein DD-endopeptidase MepM/ murein hydrolase activator NlpD|nr:M23 family metallopeptidase [Chthoniobacterales bacterium]